MVFVILLSFFPFFKDGDAGSVDKLHQDIYEIMDNNPDSALVLADHAVELAKDISYTWGLANSYYIKGYILDEVQNKSVAGLYMYLKAAHILENEEDSRSIKTYADNYINVGSILRIHNKHQEAIDIYQQAINKLDVTEFQERKLFLLYNLAFAQLDHGDLQTAIEVISKAIDLSRALDNIRVLNYSYNLLGMILIKDGRTDKALETFRHVIANLPANTVSQANASNSLADHFLEKSDVDSALHYYRLAVSFMQGVEDPVIPFYSYCGLAKCYYQMEDYNKGIQYGKEALLLYDSIVAEDEHLEIFNTMSRLYVGLGDVVQGNSYLKRYYDETQQFFDDQEELIRIKNEFQIDILLAGFYNEIEWESRSERYTKSFITAATILLGISLLILFFLNRKHSHRYKKAIDIIHGVR